MIRWDTSKLSVDKERIPCLLLTQITSAMHLRFRLEATLRLVLQPLVNTQLHTPSTNSYKITYKSFYLPRSLQ